MGKILLWLSDMGVRSHRLAYHHNVGMRRSSLDRIGRASINSFYPFSCLHEESKNKFVTFRDIAWARLRKPSFLTLALRNV